MTSARLSDLSVPLKGEVRRSPEQSAWQPIARSGKIVRRASSRRALGCEETTVLCFLPSWSTLLFEKGLGEGGGWGKRGDFTWLPAVKHQRPSAKTTNSHCCDRAVAQVKQHPNNPGERTVLKKLLRGHLKISHIADKRKNFRMGGRGFEPDSLCDRRY